MTLLPFHFFAQNNFNGFWLPIGQSPSSWAHHSGSRKGESQRAPRPNPAHHLFCKESLTGKQPHYHLCIVYSWFHATMAEMSSCDRDHLTSENIYDVILYKNACWPWSRTIRCQQILPKFLPMTPSDEVFAPVGLLLRPLSLHLTPTHLLKPKKLISLLPGFPLQNQTRALLLHGGSSIHALYPQMRLLAAAIHLGCSYWKPTERFHVSCGSCPPLL